MSIFSALLFLHVCIAAIGLSSGFVALLSPKGRVVHLKAGQVFLVSMLAMTVIALCLAILHGDLVSIVPSMLTFYLVATGWYAIARKPGGAGQIDIAMLCLALAAGTTGVVLGLKAAHHVTGSDDDGFPAAVYFIFGSVAFLAAALDVRMLASRGLRGAHRLARHLWRMCVAMFIAATSFFQGQEQVFPQQLHGTLLLKAPALLVLATMLYWLLRLLLARPPTRSSGAPSGDTLRTARHVR